MHVHFDIYCNFEVHSHRMDLNVRFVTIEQKYDFLPKLYFKL